MRVLGQKKLEGASSPPPACVGFKKNGIESRQHNQIVLSLYLTNLRSTTFGSKDIGIRKSEFVAKT